MSKRWLVVVAVGLAIAFVVAVASPLASSHPDGLEKVAEEEGFIAAGEEPSYEIIPDYTFPGVDNEEMATILSGIAGVIIVAVIGFAVTYVMKVRSNRDPGGATSNPGSE